MSYFEAQLVSAWRAVDRAAHQMAAMHFLLHSTQRNGQKGVPGSNLMQQESQQSWHCEY